MRTQINNTHNTQTKHNPQKANNAKTAKQNWVGLGASQATRPRNEVGLF